MELSANTTSGGPIVFVQLPEPDAQLLELVYTHSTTNDDNERAQLGATLKAKCT